MEAMAELSVGERDARLLTLREQLFGRQLSSVTVCPRCRQRLELAFDVADIRQPLPAQAAGSMAELTLAMDGYRVQFRLPNSADLSSVAEVADPDAAPRAPAGPMHSVRHAARGRRRRWRRTRPTAFDCRWRWSRPSRRV